MTTAEGMAAHKQIMEKIKNNNGYRPVTFKMSPQQERHIARVITAAEQRMYEKYKFGCEEHATEYSGELLDVPLGKIVEHAIDEAVDQLIYLLTVKEKLDDGGDRTLPSGAGQTNIPHQRLEIQSVVGESYTR